MNWPSVLAFLHQHKEGLELFAMAAIVTMRKTLPWPFSLIPPMEWGYEWLRDALMTLLSLKGPVLHGTEAQSSERVTKGADGSVESTKETSVTGAAPQIIPDPAPIGEKP